LCHRFAPVDLHIKGSAAMAPTFPLSMLHPCPLQAPAGRSIVMDVVTVTARKPDDGGRAGQGTTVLENAARNPKWSICTLSDRDGGQSKAAGQ